MNNCVILEKIRMTLGDRNFTKEDRNGRTEPDDAVDLNYDFLFSYFDMSFQEG